MCWISVVVLIGMVMRQTVSTVLGQPIPAVPVGNPPNCPAITYPINFPNLRKVFNPLFDIGSAKSHTYKDFWNFSSLNSYPDCSIL